MSFNTILVENKENIGVIVLNRPDTRNALSHEMSSEITLALQELSRNKDVGAIILRAMGPSFCAGADIKGVQENAARPTVQKRDYYVDFLSFPRSFQQLNKPIVAAVHSHCLGAGLAMALFSDIIIASDDAIFGLPEVNVGLFPAPMFVRALYQNVGMKKAFEFVALGNLLKAEDAEKMGLVNKVVPGVQLEEAAMDVAKRLASFSPLALRMGKEAFYRSLEMSNEEILTYSSMFLAVIGSSEDVREGSAAFREKRKPVWKGC